MFYAALPATAATDECHGGVSVRGAGLGPVFSMTRD